MGHSSRKKKKSGGGRKTRGKAPSKDHSSQPGDDNELLSEELTALAAIFQEDIKVISEPNHTQLVISLRPYLNDMCIEELSLSALLLVRFLPGYPHKCPKLQIVPEKGLTEKDADRLLSVIVDQAIINSREGRVMIFNLVEAAQEFLSEIAPAQHPFESVRFFQLDLCGDESSWGDHGTKAVNSNQRRPATGHAIPFDKYNTGITLLNEGSTKLEKMASFQHLLQKEYSQVYQTKGVMPKAATTLHVLEEEIEQETMVDGDSNSPSVSGPDDTIDASEKDFDSIENEDLKSFEHIKDCSVSESDNASFSSSSLEEKHDSELHRRKKDLLMVHLLRVACSSNEALSHVFPAISSELYNLGVISAWAKELSNGSPSTFSKTFGHLFSNDSESRISQLWKATSNFTKDKMSLNSRYLNDFEEIHSLGHGGFGHVVLCEINLMGDIMPLKDSTKGKKSSC
ncbi:hypothetical protein HPP92_023710 [Vanilla planifolia]|uniref:RWD domain-containing protein n=1 Tax=Vanilla planifolia TaxID=51239 RepID=A0A835PWP7_VANPL|nr:hypothetical protein HPP92_023710 [Vanilla planifolia]